jgi:hypothetical protein
MTPGGVWGAWGRNKAAALAGTPLISVLVLVFLAGALAVTGCGRKADPVVPHQDPPPRIQDLAGEVTGNTLELAWTLPPAGAGGAPAVSVTLFQSRALTGDTVCPACPPAFKPVATVPVETVSGSRPMSWQLRLETGYGYRFKATVHAADGRVGEDSNWVVLDH